MGSGESKQSQEPESEQREEMSNGLKAVCAVACASAALIWSLSYGEQGKASKLMKAPGRKGQLIERAVFEKDPKAYFRGLHGKKQLE